MMEVECPKCGEKHEIDGEDLPDNVCDDEEFECHNIDCMHTFKIGWYATAEVRGY